MTTRNPAPRRRDPRRARLPHALRWPPFPQAGRQSAAGAAAAVPRPKGAARPRRTPLAAHPTSQRRTETATPNITNDTHDTRPDLESEPQHRIQEPKNESQNEPRIESQNEAKNEAQNKSQTKINYRAHLGITISWGGPAAVAAGPESTGGARC